MPSLVLLITAVDRVYQLSSRWATTKNQTSEMARQLSTWPEQLPAIMHILVFSTRFTDSTRAMQECLNMQVSILPSLTKSSTSTFHRKI